MATPPGHTAQLGQTDYLGKQTDRFYLQESFLQKPGLNADLASTTESVRVIANRDFELSGTGASSGDCTLDTGGGVKIETDGTSLDDEKIIPHLDTTQSAWTSVTWRPDKQVSWGCIIETGASIQTILWAGLKLTSTDVIATDADQAFFRYQTGVSSGQWTMNDSTSGTDNSNNTDVTVAVSTQYKLEVKIDAQRKPHYYINGVYKGTGAALLAAASLIPYIAVTQISDTAINIKARRQWVSRAYA
jgi:hypothetical protein